MKVIKYPKFPGDNRKPEEIIRDINTTLQFVGISNDNFVIKSTK